MKVNKKLIRLLLVFITLFTITLNVYAIDPNAYITGENNNEQTEVTQPEETPTEEPQVTDNQQDENDQTDTIEVNSKVEEKIGDYYLVIEDDANLLSSEEIDKLKERMRPLTKYGHIVYKSISTNPKSSTQDFAEDYYYSKFENESGTIFIIDMDKRMIYIVSSGANYKTVTKGKAETITDNVYKYASRKEYYECADEAFEQIEIVLGGGKIAEPMRHASNVVVAIVVAFFINFFIVLGASKLKKASNSEIIKNCDIMFEAGNVSGTKTGTHSVYSPPSSSSGGSSGGGGGGGGGFSGGGGGHSF